MEGYTAWYKYQTEAAIHLLRWNSEFTEKVWNALSNCLQPYQNDSNGKALDPISAALVLRGQQATALADLSKQCNITEQQLWALLIAQGTPDTTSLDRLSDARDQIHRLTAQGDFAQQQRLHANFNLGTATRQLQSKKAKQERVKLGDYRNVTIKEIVSNLVSSPLNRRLTAKELWPQLFSKLEEHQLDPEEDLTPGQEKYSYDGPNARKTLTFKSFSNIVSRVK